MTTRLVFKILMILCIARGILCQKLKNTSTASMSGIYSVAYVTVPTNEVAKKLAHGLVKNKLAACVNIIPQITSVYEWENNINEDNELLLMIKTRTETVNTVTEYVKENHPYEVCEVISMPIQDGNKEYLNWISKVVPPVKKEQEN